MRLDGAALTSYEDERDFVVVGSGAAGATVAKVLAEAGRSVLVLEEGPAVAPESFHDRAYDSFRTLFREATGQVARGRAFIPVLQGRCLGGSTTVNSAIVWRLPEDILDEWERDWGLGAALPRRELHRHWDAIEKDLSVSATPPEVWGELNGAMDRAARRLGVGAAPTRRYARGCRATGRCLTGCPTGAKQSMLVSYLPAAEAAGAALASGFEARRVRFVGDRAAAVEGRLASGGRFAVRARRAVVLAASAIQTPQLLARSGVSSPHLGEHFQGHPGSPMTGVFDAPVRQWKGATQGYDADHCRREGRFKIETIGLPPEIVFARLPGAGRRWAEGIARAGRLATFAVQMRAWAQGSVRERPWGTDISYDLTARDMGQARRGLRFAAELLFAAGAREVWPGIHGLPEVLKPGEESLIERGPADPACYSWIVSHLFGTARMSARASGGVVGHDFGVHGTRGLFVADSSWFPTNIGVNPQHAIMAGARHLACRLAERGK